MNYCKSEALWLNRCSRSFRMRRPFKSSIPLLWWYTKFVECFVTLTYFLAQKWHLWRELRSFTMFNQFERRWLRYWNYFNRPIMKNSICRLRFDYTKTFNMTFSYPWSIEYMTIHDKNNKICFLTFKIKLLWSFRDLQLPTANVNEVS